MSLIEKDTMLQPLFLATKPFSPQDSERWQSYLDWAQISQLSELVSLDSMLNPHLITDIIDEGWNHIVNEDYRLSYFTNLDYMLTRLPNTPNRNILGLYRNPDSHITTPPAPASFEFLGYDLIEEQTQISALTNCGGYPETFSNSEINPFGLISDYPRASQIQDELYTKNP